MRNRSSRLLRRVMVVAAALLFTGGPTAGQVRQPAKSWAVPRTAWGHPDLQGFWNNETATPVERPREFGSRALLTDAEFAEREAAVNRRSADNPEERAPLRPGDTAAGPEHWYEFGKLTRRTSLVTDPPDGRIPPLTAAALQRLESRERARSGRGEADSWEDRSLWERCITRPMPAAMEPNHAYNSNYQILQTPDYVVILMELIHDVRLIPLDGRPHLGTAVRQWFGDSRGRWDGDTLVVETTNFVDRLDGGPIMASHTLATEALRGGREFSGATLRLTERFTRIDPETINYEYTVEDPNTFTRPYTVSIPMNHAIGLDRIYEYACHEGNYGMANMLTGGRANEEAAREGAAREASARKRWVEEEKKRVR